MGTQNCCQNTRQTICQLPNTRKVGASFARVPVFAAFMHVKWFGTSFGSTFGYPCYLTDFPAGGLSGLSAGKVTMQFSAFTFRLQAPLPQTSSRSPCHATPKRVNYQSTNQNIFQTTPKQCPKGFLNQSENNQKTIITR